MKLNKDTYNAYKKHPEKILQFGEGNFLRAFVDKHIDQMNKEADFNSGVIVIQPIETGLIDILNKQDGLYTSILRGIKDGEPVSENTIINCITRGINPYIDYKEYIKLGENPKLRFVISNTTEAGIALNKNDQLEDTPQSSYPGKLTALLYHRYNFFGGDQEKGLIIIPCELIDRNGDNLKKIILKYIDLWNLGEEFRKWIYEANTFCNSLVDRIVTGYPKDRIDKIHNELGYKDQLVVEGEQFHLWVIEGPDWIKNEFPVEKAGLNIVFVDDMTPYRTRKVRILNGAHTNMVPVAYLYGIDTVKEAIENEVIGNFVKKSIFNEIIPTLDLPKEELESFAYDVIDRFKNPYIRHELISIALNSMSKFETRVLPSILEYKEREGEFPQNLTFSLAALIAFYRGQRKDEEIVLKDDAFILKQCKVLWNEFDGTEDGLNYIVSTILSDIRIWKINLNEIEGLKDTIVKHLIIIIQKGIKIALQGVQK